MTRLHVLAAVALAAALALPAQALAAPPKGDPFSDEAVDKAIKRGVAYLWSLYRAKGAPWKEAGRATAPGVRPRPHEENYGGATAQAVCALLTAGEDYQDPRMKRALDWLAKTYTPGTYTTAVKCQIWEKLPGDVGRKRLRADAKRLVDSVDRPTGPPSRDRSIAERYGSHSYFCFGKPDRGSDNSNTQFAMLGVWAAARQDAEAIPKGYWSLAYKHWVLSQNPDGGWGYEFPHARDKNGPKGNRHSTGSMTAGGIASLFIAIDNLHSKAFIRCGAKREEKAVKRGLEWLEKNFAIDKNPGGNPYYYYYLYALERAGLASGYKHFGDKDWYRLVATRLIRTQGGNGCWGRDYTGRNNTAFALLFLARGRNPVIFNRLRYDGDWNNRPRALANVTRWVSGKFEREVNWQIINIDAKVSEWHDSQTLLISGSKAPKFDEKQLDKIRKFVYQGGTILSVAECGSRGRAFDQAMRKHYAELFGPYELTPLSKEHPLYTVHFKLKRQTKIWAISNGVRVLALHTTADIVLPWQKNAVASRGKTFELGANINFFVNDRTMGRARATSAWPAASGATPSRTVAVARVKYDGNWEPEPLAWRRMKLIMANKWQTNIKLGAPVTWQELDAKQWPLAAVTGTGPLTLSGAEKGALKAYVQAGGTVLMDAAGGSEPFADSARELAQEMFGKDSVARLGAASPVYKMTGMEISSVKYRKGVAGGSTTPRLRAATVGGRAAVFISGDDLTTGLLGCPAYGCKGYAPDSAVQLVRNIVLYAAGSGD